MQITNILNKLNKSIYVHKVVQKLPQIIRNVSTSACTVRKTRRGQVERIETGQQGTILNKSITKMAENC